MNKIPVNGSDDYRIEKLLDITSFAELLEGYYQATGIPNGLVGPGGELITQAGWIDACTRFHRGHEETNRRCVESNCTLLEQAQTQKVCNSLCKNGLYDYATPINIDGKHIATLFMGQLLHQPPDLGYYEQQAERFNYDKAAYIEAIKQVPVIPKAQLEKQLNHMVQVTTVLAKSALSTIREHHLQEALSHSKKQRIEIKDLLDNSPTGISWCDEACNIEYINHTFTRILGYTLEDLPNVDSWYKTAYPDPEVRHPIEKIFKRWLNSQKKSNGAFMPPLTTETTVRCKDGTSKRISSQVSAINQKILYNCTDITEKWRIEQRNLTRNRMMERVAQGEQLNSIMHQLITDIESDDPSIRCSILLLDSEGRHLLNCAAPSLPDFYNEAIHGVEIGEGVGSCGTAAFLGKRVIVEDIDIHPYWTPYRELAARAGLKACWSEPIISSTGRVLGSFAIYHNTPNKPDDHDIEMISFAANLASIAIETLKNREELVRSEQAYRSLAENAPDAIARYDGAGDLIYTNPNFAALFASDMSENDSYLEHYRSVIRKVIRTGTPQQVEICIHAGSNHRYLMFNIVSEENEGGGGALAIGRDITLHREMEHKLEKQARSDFLTQLINRRHFFELANREMLVASRYNNALSLIMFDLDHFKQVNDTYGHAIGDLVLQRIADVSLTTVRAADILARLGGEEFVVLMVQTSHDEALQSAERLRQAIASTSIALGSGEAISVTASFGVTTIHFDSGDSHTINHMISDADKAMYRAKQEGRNRVVAC
ncbi:diguanylate cyclase [Amphritea pacifica]|uniref:diguanylate cyclase n=1 Tax=Amphritea pacifica TaxID=2811233 RepID=A0ABS2WCV0_9GAMM|nr:diguanylate cyclase [Amphritea pacifica]MBN0989337.1 diguanylate cyclase [Amphritea pacifica]